MKVSPRVCVVGLLALILFGLPRTGAPATLLIDNGILVGATDIAIGGTLYDVAFVDNTCAAVFSGCNSSGFDFTTPADAEAAAAALLEQLFGSGDLFDTNPTLTAGCAGSGESGCGMVIPFALGGLGFQTFSAFNFAGAIADTTLGPGSVALSVNLSTVNFLVFADFSPAGPVSVPEPSSLILLGTGIAGIAARVRRSRNHR